MTAEMAIRRMNEPMECMCGAILACEIDFINNENREDETSFQFEINGMQKYWRDELLSCWEDFRKENNLNENCVTSTWITLLMYGLSNEKTEKLIKDIKNDNEELKK